jgi:hypothetical protein
MFDHLDDPSPPPYSPAVAAKVKFRAEAIRTGSSRLRVVTAPTVSRPVQPATTTTPSTPRVPSGAATVLVRGLYEPVAWLSKTGLYVAASGTANGSGQVLRLVDPLTGQIKAEAALPGPVQPAQGFVLSDGTLWVDTESDSPPRSAQLLAMSPATLHIRHRLVLADAGIGLAAAGGWLWADTTRALLKIAPDTAKVTDRVPLPAAATDDIAANTSGTVLAATQQGDIVDLLDPSTGAVIHRYQGVQGNGAFIVGIADGQIYTESGTGMESEFQRFDLTDRRFSAIPGDGYSPILVLSGNRLLNHVGFQHGPSNFCASASTGRILAALPKGLCPRWWCTG